MVSNKNVNIDAILNNANDNQLFIMEKFSRLIGRILSNVEIALPEGKRYSTLRRLLNDNIYSSRNDLLSFFVDDIEIEEAKNKINSNFASISEFLDNKLEIAFPQINQQKAIKSSVTETVDSILAELIEFFENR